MELMIVANLYISTFEKFIFVVPIFLAQDESFTRGAKWQFLFFMWGGGRDKLNVILLRAKTFCLAKEKFINKNILNTSSKTKYFATLASSFVSYTWLKIVWEISVPWNYDIEN